MFIELESRSFPYEETPARECRADGRAISWGSVWYPWGELTRCEDFPRTHRFTRLRRRPARDEPGARVDPVGRRAPRRARAHGRPLGALGGGRRARRTRGASGLARRARAVEH